MDPSWETEHDLTSNKHHHGILGSKALYQSTATPGIIPASLGKRARSVRSTWQDMFEEFEARRHVWFDNCISPSELLSSSMFQSSEQFLR